MLKVSVKNQQQVKAALRQALEDFKTDKSVVVGIQESAGTHDNSGITNAHLGAVLHYGTADGHIPARPWLDVGVATGNAEYAQIVEDAVKSDEPLEGVLPVIGLIAQGKAQQYMTALKTPPNAPSTIAAKKSANPLIDTGILRGSVTNKVIEEMPQEGLE